MVICVLVLYCKIKISKNVVQENYCKAKDILLKLANKKQRVSMDDLFFLQKWIEANYKDVSIVEDLNVIVEDRMKENDIIILDEFDYYRSIMEETPSY